MKGMFPGSLLAATLIVFGCSKPASDKGAASADSAVARTETAQSGANKSRSALPSIKKAPTFSFINYDGRRISDKDLEGNIYIAEFFFSTCKGPCPIMNSNATVLQSEFASVPNFRIVSITVDPETDTPEQLKRYAQRYGAKKDRWYFLRGDKNVVCGVSADGFLMGDEEDPMLHSTHFALVDAKGMIRGYYDALDNARVDSLRQAIRSLVQEKG